METWLEIAVDGRWKTQSKVDPRLCTNTAKDLWVKFSILKSIILTKPSLSHQHCLCRTLYKLWTKDQMWKGLFVMTNRTFSTDSAVLLSSVECLSIFQLSVLILQPTTVFGDQLVPSCSSQRFSDNSDIQTVWYTCPASNRQSWELPSEHSGTFSS